LGDHNSFVQRQHTVLFNVPNPSYGFPRCLSQRTSRLRAQGRVATVAAADQFAKRADRFAKSMASILHSVRAEGALTLRSMAASLNRRGIKSARGGDWHPSSVAQSAFPNVALVFVGGIPLNHPPSSPPFPPQGATKTGSRMAGRCWRRLFYIRRHQTRVALL
jgi:hypothetical protein